MRVNPKGKGGRRRERGRREGKCVLPSPQSTPLPAPFLRPPLDCPLAGTSPTQAGGLRPPGALALLGEKCQPGARAQPRRAPGPLGPPIPPTTLGSATGAGAGAGPRGSSPAQAASGWSRRPPRGGGAEAPEPREWAPLSPPPPGLSGLPGPGSIQLLATLRVPGWAERRRTGSLRLPRSSASFRGTGARPACAPREGTGASGLRPAGVGGCLPGERGDRPSPSPAFLGPSP